jgi:large subunit ribosomal protein L17
MRHRVKGRKLGRNAAQRKALMRNLAISLILHERIRTTEAKAKELRPYVEKLVTISREDSQHGRNIVMQRLSDDRAVEKLFDVLGPRFEDQPGGYTRIYKLGPRNGDGAGMALVELVVEAGTFSTPIDSGEDEPRRRRLRRPSRRRAGATEEPPEAVADEDERAADESVEESSEDEPVETPGDADSETSGDSPGRGEQKS